MICYDEKIERLALLLFLTGKKVGQAVGIDIVKLAC